MIIKADMTIKDDYKCTSCGVIGIGTQHQRTLLADSLESLYEQMQMIRATKHFPVGWARFSGDVLLCGACLLKTDI